MSRLLIDEDPLVVQPSLAVAIGLNEAMFMQQLHFWLKIAEKSGSGREHDKRIWSYKTFEEWQQDNFPFWSVSTIKRLVNKLVKSGLILVEKLDDFRRIQTNFYTINYQKLKEISKSLSANSDSTKSDDGVGQNDTMESVNMSRPIVSEWHDDSDITENTTETTATEIKKEGHQYQVISDSEDSSPFDIFWSAYPKKVAKLAAEKAFKKLKPNAELLKTILQSLDNFKNGSEWKKENGRFIPNPATWLNGRRWEDELGDVDDSSDDPFAGAI